MSDDLQFSWLLPYELGGCIGQRNDQDLRYLVERGIKCLVRLADIDEALVSSEQVEKVDLKDFHEPVSDYCSPSQAQIDRVIRFIEDRLSSGESVAVSCRAGVGRTGVILACYLIHIGLDAAAALSKVRENRLGAVKLPQQENAVWRYEKRVLQNKISSLEK